MVKQYSKWKRSIYLKQCPRCSGDLATNQDHYGNYLHCLQCGYMADVEQRQSSEHSRLAELRDDVA